MKNIYIAVDQKKDGDEFVIVEAFDLSAAKEAALEYRRHLTANEREKANIYIKVFETTAETLEEWNEEVNEWCCEPDGDIIVV